MLMRIAINVMSFLLFVLAVIFVGLVARQADSVGVACFAFAAAFAYMAWRDLDRRI